MILVTGGAFQGKTEFAKTLKENLINKEQPKIVDAQTIMTENLQQIDIVKDFHLLIRRLLEQGLDARREVSKLLEKNPNLILVVDELGCGIIPADAFERSYRETVGRICCEIAADAQAVYRVNCGIGIRIK